ncbi:family 78 glycoside hydrolase catalytic domain [Sphingobacterium bovistauri]|uniref:alpha-L-rhamnosidase n=1 Tax=Sphingobacterium bovistauri TaxID=2781959 RepID=A0ABS7Z6Z3_9SPHI|nr:family 78 glycoside hydrolase catalytic domain [Sphingobacterium bovistauri]MCA5004719.1 family 78 glycoside hydrolase catalytic domain [Sphingobacterium bovistauri]
MTYLREIILIFFLGVISTLNAQVKIKDVRVEGRENPLGINSLNPVFSWKLIAEKNGLRQVAYRIVVYSKDDLSSSSLMWDSKWKKSSNSLFVKYSGSVLSSSKKYFVKIQVKDNEGKSAESDVYNFQIGLLSSEDWSNAKWITLEKLPDSLINPLPLSSSRLQIREPYDLPVFRKSVNTKSNIKSSYAFVSGLGHFVLLLNGQKVENNFLEPGWTKYDKEAYYVVYDLTDKLNQGKNTFSVLLGNGFYYIPPIRGRFQKHKVAFGLPKVKMKVITEYQDGTIDVLNSDESWKVHKSPITFSSMYGGEDFDGNILPNIWTSNSYDDSNWKNAIIVDGPALKAQEIEPTRIMESFKPKNQKTLSHRKSIVYDFGQNASGIVTLKMSGNKGDTIRVYPAELLNNDGSANQKHSGSPHYYQYIFGDQKQVIWSPKFTYYGLRYAEVFKKPLAGSKIEIQEIQLDHIRNSTVESGTFSSSDTLFNQIHNLIKWGIKSNMVSVFTDCPHREKLGWLEQLHLMGPSVQYNFNSSALFAKALYDMRQSQTVDGLVPEIAPEYVQFDWGGDMFRDSPEWGSSSILLAWYAYKWYGDETLLTENYPMMKRYVHYLKSKAKNNILYQGLSDWYDIGKERPGVSQLTPHGVTGTSIYHYDLTVMSKIAEKLGYKSDRQYFDSLAVEVKKAFNNEFFNSQNGIYATGSQTAQAMPIYMNIFEPQYKTAVFENLLKDIFIKDTTFTSGDVGHRYLIQALTEHDRDDVIYAMHKDDTRPGYGYQIRKGATALTESWAALPTVSNNHFMLGHLMEWFHANLGGIKQADNSVAYNHVWIEPKLIDVVKSVKVSYHSPYGEIILDRKGDNYYSVHIPIGSKATVSLPAYGHYKVNGKNVKTKLSKDKARVEIELTAGKFLITK